MAWQSQGKIIADHKEHMVKKVREADNKTSLYSSWMASTDAQRQLEMLLADLGKGPSWLNMYKMTAKVVIPTLRTLKNVRHCRDAQIPIMASHRNAIAANEYGRLLLAERNLLPDLTTPLRAETAKDEKKDLKQIFHIWDDRAYHGMNQMAWQIRDLNDAGAEMFERELLDVMKKYQELRQQMFKIKEKMISRQDAGWRVRAERMSRMTGTLPSSLRRCANNQWFLLDAWLFKLVSL